MNSNTPIRIFVDAHVFDNEHQGSRTFIKELYCQLANKKNLQLFIAARNINGLKNNFPSAPNITFIQYTTGNRFWRLLVQIPRLLKKHKIDYAHFQYIIPLFKPCRFIVTIHDVLFNDFPGYFSGWYRFQKNILYRYAARHADILTTVSRHSQQAIERHFKISSDRIFVIPHGVAACFFESYNKQAAQKYIRIKYDTGKIILYVSRFEPRKNHDLLLKAFVTLGLYKKGYTLVCCGHASLPVPAFTAVFNSIPQAAKDCVLLLHQLDDAALLQLYKAATVFVYPSAAEGFGMPPLEAAALGIPVICNNQTALADFSFFKATHFDITNDSLFKETLQNVLSRNMELETAEIKQILLQQYSWENSAATFLERVMQNYHHDRF